MVFSYYLIKYPYKLVWKTIQKFRIKKKIHFFVADEMDYIVFRNVHKFLPKVRLVAATPKIRKILQDKYAVKSQLYPSFPNAIIMARHSLHKYPEEKIIKIGMRHGPYHFKQFIGSAKYNRFDLFFMTSEKEVDESNEFGIVSAENGGYPKCDSLFDSERIKHTQVLKQKLFKSSKPTILFSSTWDKSKISAIDYWYNSLERFTQKFNVLVTVHPWTKQKYIDIIKKTENIIFIDTPDLTEYLLMADILISDTSSIIAEFMVLDKPIITFRVPVQGRLTDDIYQMIEDSTYRVDSLDEMDDIISMALQNPKYHSFQRIQYVNRMFAPDLGNHSILMARKIRDFLKTKGIKKKRLINKEGKKLWKKYLLQEQLDL